MMTLDTHGTRIIAENGQQRLVEIYPRAGEGPAERFYIVRYDERADQVYSVLKQDHPGHENGAAMWFAAGNGPAAIAHVAHPLTLHSAQRRWRSLTGQLVPLAVIEGRS